MIHFKVWLRLEDLKFSICCPTFSNINCTHLCHKLSSLNPTKVGYQGSNSEENCKTNFLKNKPLDFDWKRGWRAWLWRNVWHKLILKFGSVSQIFEFWFWEMAEDSDSDSDLDYFRDRYAGCVWTKELKFIEPKDLQNAVEWFSLYLDWKNLSKWDFSCSLWVFSNMLRACEAWQNLSFTMKVCDQTKNVEMG